MFDTRLPIVGTLVVLAVLVGLIARVLWNRRPESTHRVEGRPAPLSIVGAQFEALPDQPPTLVGDTLRVRVAYDGDCKDHGFGLRSTRRGDTLALRLTHDAGGDRCSGRVYDELRLPAPDAARSARVLVLDDPEGGRPFSVVRATPAPAAPATR